MKSQTSVLAAFAFFGSAIGSPTLEAKSLQRRWDPPPLPGCTPYTPFNYVGCFIEENPTTLVYNTELDFSTMTVEICTDTCKSNGFKYAGLEYYGKCYCGTILSTPAPESDCNAPCNGNQTEMCGGVTARLSIYEDPTYPIVDPADVLSGYVYQGCYTEPGDYRAVSWRQGQLDFNTLTVEECLTTCGQGSYPYAAVEWSGECYCGTLLINGSVQAPSSDCSDPCTGNPSEICGGSERLDLYYAGEFVSTQPCGYVPPTSPSGACNGTAYGYVAGECETFTSLNIGSNWGWVISGSLPITGQLYQGAGGNDLSKGTIVGSFTIAHVGSNIVITYQTNPPYVIQQDHFYYGSTYPSHIAPGQFGHSHSFSTAVSTDSFTLPYSSSQNTYIVHAVVGSPQATGTCTV